MSEFDDTSDLTESEVRQLLRIVADERDTLRRMVKILRKNKSDYAHPPCREPLTEDEIFQATRKLYSSEEGARFDFPANVEVARLIEQAHGIGGDE